MSQALGLARHPLFLKALKAFKNNYSHFLRLKNHPDLTLGEKRLLEARYLQKRKRFRRACDLLESISNLPETLEAQRRYQLVQMKDALGVSISVEEMRELRNALELLGDVSGHFTVSIDLAIILSQTGDCEGALALLDEVRIRIESDWQQANWLRCRAQALARLDRKQEFDTTALELERLIPRLKPSHTQLCLSALAYGRMLLGDLSGALALYERTLSRYRSADTFSDRFWYLLLRILVHEETLRPTPPPFRERESFFLRYNIVRSLQCGSVENARKDWLRLHQLRPELYGKPFQILSPAVERTAFGRCLKKFLRQPQAAANHEIQMDRLTPLMRTLVELLAGAPGPLGRAQLIELVYHQPYSPKLDGRFYELISSTRERGVPIRHRSGAYFLSTS